MQFSNLSNDVTYLIRSSTSTMVESGISFLQYSQLTALKEFDFTMEGLRQARDYIKSPS